MPRTGGEADKLGNRYEALWIADAVLDLLDGAYRDLVFEPIGEEADGIEFAAAIGPAQVEYHSIKRQQPGGNWTVRLLAATRPNGRSILGDLVRKAEAGAEVVFGSGTSATQLEELSERARKSDTLDDFLQSAGQNATLLAQFRAHIVPLCGDEQAGFDSLARLRVRVKNEAELGRDVERRMRWSLRPIDAERPGSGIEALSFWGFALDRLGRTITAPMVWQWLETRGLRAWQLAGDADVGRQMETRNRLVLEEAEARLINNAAIPRAEADLALEQLLQGERSVMIEGPAGGGKVVRVRTSRAAIGRARRRLPRPAARPAGAERPPGPPARPQPGVAGVARDHAGRVRRGPSVGPLHRPARRDQSRLRSPAVGPGDLLRAVGGGAPLPADAHPVLLPLV